LIVLYIIFGGQLIMVFFFIYITCKINRSRKKTSTILTYSIKIFSFFALLMNTILTIPFFSIFLSALICFDDDKIHGNTSCYSGIYFLHFVFGLVGLLIQIFFALLFNLLFIDLNPYSNIPFSGPQSRLGLIKLLIKFALPLYITLDYKVKLLKLLKRV